MLDYESEVCYYTSDDKAKRLIKEASIPSTQGYADECAEGERKQWIDIF